MRRLSALTAVCVALFGLAACNVLPAQAPQPQLHDFGPPPASQDGDPVLPVQVARVTAPAWLADDAIHYRLLYSDPTTFRSYADNRWAASPAELLDAGLRYVLPPGPGQGPGGAYVLDIQLLEFEQDISSPHDATVRLVLQASLRRAGDGQVVAERRFEMEQATSADVQGAVAGSAQLAQKAEQAVAVWTKSEVSGPH